MTGSQQRGRRSGRVEEMLDLLAEVSARIDKAIKPLEKAFDWIIFAALLSLIAAALFPSESLALFGLSLVLAVAVPWVVSVLVWEKLGTERQRAFSRVEVGAPPGHLLLHRGRNLHFLERT